MDLITIYHNETCSKSRAALELLQEHNIPYRIRYYLTDPLSIQELSGLLKKLQIKPSELLRRKEQIFTGNFAGKEYTEEEWLDILAHNPILIERPIAATAHSAVIARPPERIRMLI